MPLLEKHLLVTVSEDPNALFGLRYVSGFFTNKDVMRLTLFYVAPRHSGGDSPLGAPICQPGQEHGADKECRRPPDVQAAARDWLLAMGFPPKRLELKTTRARAGTVKDIVAEAESGLYDALVLGRRGLTWLDETFGSSVSHGLLSENITFPLWACRGSIQGRKNVLLCVDGSEQALRAADHVGFILRDDPGHTVTIFHGKGPDSPDEASAKDITAHVRDILTQNGVPDDRIDTLTEDVPKDPAKHIMRIADTGKYAAVAVGRRSGKVFGSTSQKLLRGLDGPALWISK